MNKQELINKCCEALGVAQLTSRQPLFHIAQLTMLNDAISHDTRMQVMAWMAQYIDQEEG